MDIYYTIDEKFLQAVDEYHYGQWAKSLQLLNEIIADDPLYARAYYQLGIIYYYLLLDYQQAGKCFKTCNELEPNFPDVYEDYLQLLAFLNMQKSLERVKAKALQTPGVNYAAVWNILGSYAEKHKNLPVACKCYEEAYALAINVKETNEAEEGIRRIKAKQQRNMAYYYSLS